MLSLKKRQQRVSLGKSDVMFSSIFYFRIVPLCVSYCNKNASIPLNTKWFTLTHNEFNKVQNTAEIS